MALEGSPVGHVFPCMIESHQTSDENDQPGALTLPDGTSLRIRRIRRDDGERLASHYARLSFESRLRRFLSPKPRLTGRELSFMTDVDHVRHEAVAAVDHDGAIVATARYVQESGRQHVADVAVDVADELQNQGVGTALAQDIIDRARENGFVLLTATALWENRPARALLRRLRFNPRASHRGEIELELALDGSGCVSGRLP